MLSVRAETLGEVTVLHLRGRITIGNATKTLNEVVRAQTAACALVLDLAEVDLIDARGLGMLVELHQWTQSRGIEFRLMNVSRLIQQVMSITRLDTDFGVDEWHGTNAFIRDDDNNVFRTYFINNRGDEQMGSTWNYLADISSV